MVETFVSTIALSLHLFSDNVLSTGISELGVQYITCEEEKLLDC